MKRNELNNKLKLTFDEVKRNNPNMSLDEILYKVFEIVKDDYNESFDFLRNTILEANNIDELWYYTKNVRQDLKDYINKFIFPYYDMIFAIAACHDWGKYINHETHHLIAANNFINDIGMKHLKECQKPILKII